MVEATVKSNVGDSGYATVRLTKNTFRATFTESGITYDLPLELWEKNRPAGEYNITLSRNNDKLVSVKPIAGTYLFEFDSIGNRVNELPEPATQRGGPRKSADGKKRWFAPDSIVWRPIVRVTSTGIYEGLKVMYQLPYIFASIPGSPNTRFLADSRRDLENVETFFRLAGFDLVNREIPFSANVLPWIEKELSKEPTTFMAKVTEKGFLTDLSAVPADFMPNKKKKGK